jgi:hypothetical protein
MPGGGVGCRGHRGETGLMVVVAPWRSVQKDHAEAIAAITDYVAELDAGLMLVVAPGPPQAAKRHGLAWAQLPGTEHKYGLGGGDSIRVEPSRWANDHVDRPPTIAHDCGYRGPVDLSNRTRFLYEDDVNSAHSGHPVCLGRDENRRAARQWLRQADSSAVLVVPKDLRCADIAAVNHNPVAGCSLCPGRGLVAALRAHVRVAPHAFLAVRALAIHGVLGSGRL